MAERGRSRWCWPPVQAQYRHMVAINLRVYVGGADAVWHGILESANGRAMEIVDGKEENRVVAALGPSLFAEHKLVVVENAGNVSGDTYKNMGEHIECLGSIVGAAKTNKTIDKLKNVAEVVLCDHKWSERAVVESFKKRGIQLDARARALLIETCSFDLSRGRSVAEIARMAGLTNLSEAAARKLLGSQKKEVMVWEVCDNLFANKLAEAMAAAAEVEDIPMLANMVENLRVLLAAKECARAEELVEVVKIHPYVAKKRMETAKRFKEERIAAGLAAATGAEILVRRGYENKLGALVRVYTALFA